LPPTCARLLGIACTLAASIWNPAQVAAQEDWGARMAAENALRESVFSAIERGDPGPALAALKAGHDPSFQTFEAYDPTISMLTVAIRARQAGAVEALLKAGVRFDQGQDFTTTYDWEAAIAAGDPRIVGLMLAYKADPGQKMQWRSNGEPLGGFFTPLTRAAAAGETEIVRLLLDAGASPNSLEGSFWNDPSGTVDYDYAFEFHSALDLAANPAIEKLLLDRGATSVVRLPGVGRTAKVSDSGLRVRSDPSTTGSIIARLEAGVSLRALETTEREEIGGVNAPWVRVVLPNGTVGWVFGGFLVW